MRARYFNAAWKIYVPPRFSIVAFDRHFAAIFNSEVDDVYVLRVGYFYLFQKKKPPAPTLQSKALPIWDVRATETALLGYQNGEQS